MFDDTIALKHKTGTTTATVSEVGESSPGRTVRKDGAGVVFTVQGQMTKENKPTYDTRRVSIRLEESLKGVFSNQADPNAKIYAQLIVGFPDNEIGQIVYLQSIVAALINFVYSGGNAGALILNHDDATFAANLTRLLKGES